MVGLYKIRPALVLKRFSPGFLFMAPESKQGNNFGSKGRNRIAAKNSAKTSPCEETEFLSQMQVSKLRSAKYELAGSHSGVQVCSWSKKALRREGVCYKQKFYGVECEQCCQMSPAVLWCNENCIFCWRPMEWMQKRGLSGASIDSPEKIISGSIAARKKLLYGFKGLEVVGPERFEKIAFPSHWAISLSGEPTLYPKICELIAELKKLPGTKSVFLVTNAQETGVFRKMAKNSGFLPSQLYVSLDAPNESMFKKVNRPSAGASWENLLRSLEIISGMKTRKVVRITLIKNVNDDNGLIGQWVDVIGRMAPEFVEVKSYMHLGESRKRLGRENMPSFSEVMSWTKGFAKASGYIVKDSSRPSRIVLLVRQDLGGRSTKFKFAREEMAIDGEGIDF
ncbi:S-adenosyl-L-methionine-dependent tRNA 4-demethylwyosine synthase [uncultured archaeon]|nr:S-adenosyl-L-methionine-dependent tRNA 4-demethylwyosine synthase [uncultured archaeon]